MDVPSGMVTSAINFALSVELAGCVGKTILVAVGAMPEGVLVGADGVIVAVAVGGGEVMVAVGSSAAA